MKLNTLTTGAGPDLLLLHGWGMNNAVWGALPEVLSERYRVTRVELPGHGESDYDLSASTLDDWVQAVLTVAPERAHWIGWSLGATLALRAAAVRCERIASLVILAGTPRFVQDSDWPYAMTVENLRQFAAVLSKNHRLTLERFLSLQVRGDGAAREMLRALRQELFQRPLPHPAALEAGLDLLLRSDLRSQLGVIPCPMFWLLGERDTLVPAALAPALAELLPQSEIRVLERSAHVPFLSHPESCLEIIGSFLGGVS